MKQKCGNSRLLYRQVTFDSFDFENEYQIINNFIETNPKLMKSNASKYLYFFAPSAESNFMELPFWIGVEVIGFCSQDVLEDFDLAFKDLEASEVTCFEQVKSLDIDALKHMETEIREKNKFVNTWRVQINFDFDRGAVLQFWE